MMFGDWWRESPMSRTRPELYGICEAVWLAAVASSEALALLRELNDELKIPGWLQPRVDAVLDGHEPPEEGERKRILAEVADHLREEYLTDKTGTPEDEAYDAAVGHCIGAVIAMIGDDYGESEIQSQPQGELK